MTVGELLYMKDIAVLIPCYNEALTIAKVISDYKKALPEATIYVYDNNSSDDTAAIALASGAIVHQEHRQGKGNVIRSMFRDIEADCYLMIDGDDTYPAESARTLVNYILEDGFDMAIGDRLSSTYFSENKRLFHNTGNIVVRKMVNSFFGGSVTDIMTGYRAFSGIFVKTFPVLSKGFEIETEMTIHALDRNFSVVSIPIEYRDRPEGSVSKLNTFSDGIKVIRTIFMLLKDYRPMMFFGAIAFLCGVIGVGMLFPVLYEYYHTGLVLRFPTFIAACFFALFSLLFFFCGVILDTQGKYARQNFEIQANIIRRLGEKHE